MTPAIDLQTTADGVLLPVHAQPGARRNGVTGVHAGRLKVAVTQAPDKGKANDALVKLLAEKLEIKRAQISLVAGATSQHKKLLVTGIDQPTLAGRLARLVPE